MKKILTLVLCATMIFALAIPILATENLVPDNMVILPVAPKADIIIDGVRDDGYGEWYNLNKMRFDIAGATGKFCSAWNETGIFYYVEVYDFTPLHEHNNDFERDCIEFFIDWNANFGDHNEAQGDNPAWQVRVASAPNKEGNQTSGTLGNDVLEPGKDFVAIPINGDYHNGYIIEICLPIVLAGENAIPLAAGRELFVDFMIGDRQSGGELAGRASQTFLVPDDDICDNQWLWPYSFRGILLLGGDITTDEEEPEDIDTPEENDGDEEPDDAETPEPTGPINAAPSKQKVLFNDDEVAFDAYLINDNNYIKLRDLAYVLNGTQKQFGVDYDAETNTILLTSNTPYTPRGDEMTGEKGADIDVIVLSPQKITLDGEAAAGFTVYNINGSNYFKLREVMKTFDVYVGYDDATKTVTLDTSKSYAD